MTTLIKNRVEVFQPQQIRTETRRVFIPGRPGRPAYCTTTYSSAPQDTNTVASSCGGQISIPEGSPFPSNESLVIDGNDTGAIGTGPTGAPTICEPSGTIPGAGIRVPTDSNPFPVVQGATPKKTCFPATPATTGRYENVTTQTVIPERRFFSDNPGWNASAYSIDALELEGYSSFQLTINTGIVVGFSGAFWERVDWATIILGVYAYPVPDEGMFYRIVRNGKFITDPVLFDPTKFFAIERKFGYLYVHLINIGDVPNADGSEVVYEDKTRTVDGPLRLDAALYIAGEEVVDANIVEYGDPGAPVGIFGSESTLPAVIGRSNVSTGGGTNNLQSLNTTGILPALQAESILYRAINLPPLLGSSVVGGSFIDNEIITDAFLPALTGYSFLASAPPPGHLGTDGVLPGLRMQFSIIGANEVNTRGTLPALQGRSTFLSNGSGIQTDAVLPGLSLFSGTIIPFNMWMEAALPSLDSDGSFTLNTTSAGLEARLPPLQTRFFFGGATLQAELPNLVFEGFINNTHTELDAQLPALQAQLQFTRQETFAIQAALPLLTANFLFGGNVLSAQLPNLIAQLNFVTPKVYELNARLPKLEAEFNFLVQECIENGTFSIDAGLPSLMMEPNGFKLDATLPLLQAALNFANAMGTVQDGRTLVMNTATGELTEFSDFSFYALRQLFDKRYLHGTDNKLYSFAAGGVEAESVPASFTTHGDHRIFNDRGELVPSQNLKRNYGAYFIMRTPEGAGVVVETYLDEFDGDRYELDEEVLRSSGQDIVRVDFYRGPTAHYWGLGVRNKGTNKLSLFGVQQLIQILDRKIYTH